LLNGTPPLSYFAANVSAMAAKALPACEIHWS
jgi:hypothetical protein